MARVGRQRYVDLKLVDLTGVPVTGRQLSDLTVYFTRDNTTCGDNLILDDLGGGRYSVRYTPSAAGHDYLEIYDAVLGLTFLDVDEVEDEASFFGGDPTVALNEDYPTPGRLRVSVWNPSSYTVYAFQAEDWEAGRSEPVYALGECPVLPDGSWDGVIPVLSGTYYVIASNGDAVEVLAVNLKV